MRHKKCSECGRAVHLRIFSRLIRYGVESCADHDLCARCYKEQRDSLMAERHGPKPWWAVRPSLLVLNDEAIRHGLKFSQPATTVARYNKEVGSS